MRSGGEDRRYGSAKTIKALREQGTETYIPLWNRRRYIAGSSEGN
jgi:hypothetical protein